MGWGVHGLLSTVGPTLVDPRPIGTVHRRGTGPLAWGPQWTPTDPPPHPVKHTWAPRRLTGGVAVGRTTSAQVERDGGGNDGAGNNNQTNVVHDCG